MMDNFDDILGQLRDSSGGLKENLHIMEEVVPIEDQLRYFDYAKRVRIDNEPIDRDYLIALLFSPDKSVEEKRYSLSVLAGLTDIGAYRALETYHSSPQEPELTSWSAMALVESRILLDSDLSGEKQFLVSTGLGGSHNMLRFFCILASRDKSDFTDLQKEMLQRELLFQLEHEKIVVEEIVFKSNYVRILLLAPIDKDLKTIFNKAIAECNEFGDFVDENFMLTNIKKYSDAEIVILLKNKT